MRKIILFFILLFYFFPVVRADYVNVIAVKSDYNNIQFFAHGKSLAPIGGLMNFFLKYPDGSYLNFVLEQMLSMSYPTRLDYLNSNTHGNLVFKDYEGPLIFEKGKLKFQYQNVNYYYCVYSTVRREVTVSYIDSADSLCQEFEGLRILSVDYDYNLIIQEQKNKQINNSTASNTATCSRNPIWTQSQMTYAPTNMDARSYLSNLTQTSKNTSQKANLDNAGDPVNLATGEFDYSNTFMNIPGKNIPFEFQLNYKNQMNYNGPVGMNWDHNYNKYLVEEENGNVLYYNGKLSVMRFLKNTDGSFAHNLGMNATLSLVNGNYQLQYDSGNREYFNTEKKLSKLQDVYGNALDFSYTNGLLTQVQDTLGRKINYTYFDHNRLQAVTDFNGKKVELLYYDGTTQSGSIYDLKEVKIINGENAIKTIGFEYTIGGDDNSKHNITKLIDAKGQTYVENTYLDDRVATQKYGDGTITYTYTLNGESVMKNTVVDKVGNTTEYVYDANGNNIQTIYRENGNDIIYDYTYNSLGYLETMKLPRGNGVKYTYDSKGNMIQKRQKANINTSDNDETDIITNFTYNDKNKVLTQTNPNGSKIENTYDVNGNVVQMKMNGVKDYNGVSTDLITKYLYNPNGLLSKIVYPNKNEKNFTYSGGLLIKTIEGAGNLTLTNTFTYDTFSNLVKKVDQNGGITLMNYDDFNRLIYVKDQVGIEKKYSYDENNNKIMEDLLLSSTVSKSIHYNYNILDNVIKSVDETSSGVYISSENIYDNNGNIIQTKTGNNAKVYLNYNNFSKVIKKTIKPDENDPAKDMVTQYEYDNNGNIIKIIDPKGFITNFEYDGYDRIIKTTDANGTQNIFVYDTSGNIISKIIKDVNNNILQQTDIVYDELSREIQTKVFKENNSYIITSKIYDINGKIKTYTDGKGISKSYEYDILSRLIKEADSLGNITNYKYDKNSNIIEKNNQNGANVYNISRYTYDRINRLTKEEQVSTLTGSVSKTYSYDKFGNITKLVDGNGNFEIYGYDYRGKNISKTKYLSGNTVSLSTKYIYDLDGNLIKITDSKNQSTMYEYDNIGRLVKTTYANGKTLMYSYDKNNNIVSQTDPNGNIVTNSYDSGNKLISRNIQTGTGIIGIKSESYVYDQLDRLVEANDSNNHKLNFNYDSGSRLINENQSGAIIGYTYDDNNNLTNIFYPNSKIVSYAYDELGRIKSIKNNNDIIRNYSYDAYLSTKVTNGNNTEISKTYDDYSRLSKSEIKSILNNEVIKSYSYSYDKVGNIISDNEKNYLYDETYRLVQVKNKNSQLIEEAYAYDKAGNRINDKNQNYITNNLNQYTQVNNLKTLKGKNFTYDDNGNLKQDTKNTYEYDYKNRLVRVKNESGIIVDFQYDVLGRRYEKITDTEKINYIYSDKNIIEEIRTNLFTQAITKKSFVNGLGLDDVIAIEQEESNLMPADREELKFCQKIVLNYTQNFEKYGYTNVVTRCNALNLLPQEIVTNRYYFHKNHLGSVVGITDNSGSLVTSYEYDSYGNFVLSGSDIGNSILFTGREYDSEIKLYYYRARYYDAELGRFISRDPIGQIDDVNLYGYVGNNPVMGVDPSGLAKSLIFWGEEYLYSERGDSKYEFKIKAEAYKKYLISKGGKSDNILVVDGSTFDKWQDALKNNKNITSITYYGHSDEYGLYLGDKTSNDLSDNKFSGLETLGVSNANIEKYSDGTSDHYISELFNGNAMGANLQMFGCNSSNVAKEFAQHFEGVGVGSNNNVNFDTAPGSDVEYVPVIKPKNFFFFGVTMGGANGKTLDWNKYNFTK